MYSLSHVSAIQQCFIDVAKGSNEDYSTSLVRNMENPQNYIPEIEVRKNFEVANNLMPWTDEQPSTLGWIAAHTFLSEEISNEMLHRKQESYKIIFKINHRRIQKVTDFNPSENRDLLLTANALRDGYFVEGGRGRLKVFCPSGNVRYVTRTECGCNEFNKELRRQHPCIHLRIAKVFLEHPEAFKV